MEFLKAIKIQDNNVVYNTIFILFKLMPILSAIVSLKEKNH